jgi:multiple sugar transport system substrate-binding protein
MFRRLFIALALVGFMLTANVVAGRPTPTQAASTTISFMTFDAVPAHLNDLNTIILGFEQTHPGIHVKVIPVAYAQYFTKLQTAVAGGQAPDTFEVDYQDFVTYASRGTLLPLSTVERKGNYANLFYPRALGAFSLHKKQYGLPETFSDVLLFYNKDLFDKAHVAYPSATWKWSDELKAAQKLTSPGQGIYGDYEPIQFFEFYKVLYQAGGRFLNAKGKVAFDNATGLKAINWLVDKVNKYHVMPSLAQMGGLSDGDMFAAGKIAMDRTGIWEFPTFAKSSIHWDVQLEPGDKRKGHHYFANAIVISSHTHNAKAAYDWVKYYTSSALSAHVRVASSWELPALKNAALVKQYLKERPPVHRNVVFQALNSPVLPPVINSETQLQDIVTNDLAKVVDGSMTAQQALSDMTSQINLLH